MGRGRFVGPSPEYWAERAEYLAEKQFDGLPKREKQLKQAYLAALADMKRTLADYYARFEFTHIEAQKLISQFDLEQYRLRMEALQRQAVSPLAQSEIQKLVGQMRLTRQQALINEIESALVLLAQEEEKIVSSLLAEVYEGAYYSAAFELSKGLRTGISFTKLDKEAIELAIRYPWSGDMFSDRIWTNKALLLQTLRQNIVDGLIKGSSVQTMSRNMNNSIDTKYSNALRIIRTETSHVLNEATAKAYTESKAVKQYQFLATLDNRTSGVCGKLDGQIFNMEERQVGKNYPPMHPNCRSTVVPYFKDLDGLRIANVDGEKDYVQGNMSFTEWKTKFLV